MTDRDTFAAAALTGLLSQWKVTPGNQSPEMAALTVVSAYQLAEAMLRERSRAGQNSSEGTGSAAKCTERDSANHDAAPAAIAESDEDRTDKAATSHRRDGTGDTPATHATPPQGSEPREGTEPKAATLRGLLERLRGGR